MKTPVNRQTVDLGQFPDLVVVYLGMRVKAFTGLKTIIGIGPKIQAAGDAKPEGLLHSEQNIIYSFFPFHVGMRWYWRDFAALEAWTRSAPHKEWWKNFLQGSGGTGFWHETYCMRGGMEATFDDIGAPLGFKAFAPVLQARGSMFSARRRLSMQGAIPDQPEGMTESELH